MASIQILELRPVEDQIEDLSVDITSSIHGGDGFVENFFDSIDRFLERILDDVDIDVNQFLRCTGDLISGRINLGQYFGCLGL